MHFHCVLHAIGGGGQDSIKNAYVINGWSQRVDIMKLEYDRFYYTSVKVRHFLWSTYFHTFQAGSHMGENLM